MKQENFQFESTRFNLQTSQTVYRHVLPYLQSVSTVLDLGCGMGAWSAALQEVKEVEIQLVDHPQLPVDNLLITNKKSFTGIDLDKQLPSPGRWDLIICIEVLEHFNEKRALDLQDFICRSADLVLFSAAVPGQGGNGHINCQRHTYWHSLFAKAGFAYFDGFKTGIVHDESIPFWIRQNLFIYYKPRFAALFCQIPNYTPVNFELAHYGTLRTDMGLKAWLKLGPGILLNFMNRVRRKFIERV